MLIRNEIELKAQLGGLQKNVNWATWAPFIEQAERKHLRPWLGVELLQQLNAHLTGGQPNAALDALLELLRPAAAYYAQVEAMPMLNVRIGEGGIQEGQGAVRQWSYLEAQMASVATADGALDS